MINSVTISGNLVRDMEKKYFNSGDCVLQGTLAVNKQKKVGDEWINKPQFFDFKYSSKGADKIHQYLTKGKHITIQGELAQDVWEKDGQKHSKIYIHAFQIEFDQKPKDGQSTDQQPPAQAQSESIHDGHFEDDIPF